MKAANLGVRFLLELAMLTALAYVGWRLPDATWQRVVLAVLLPGGAVILWGRYVSPKAPQRLTDPARLALEAVLFSGATGGLALAGRPAAALALAASYALNTALAFRWRQRAS